MPRLRRRAAGLGIGAILLFVVGTSVQAGWLLVLASCLLGVAVTGAMLPRRMLRGVDVERRAPAEAFQGDEVEVYLVVMNGSRGMRLGLDVRDEHLEPARVFVGHLGPGERAIVTTARRARRRGVFQGSDVVVSSSAPFGVADRRRRLAVAGETVVYPSVERLNELAFVDASPTHERALHAYPLRGDGPDYLGVREYRSGDSMRHVHWPSTARTGELMVREFEREQTRRVAIVIDASADVGEGGTPLDRCCSVAASISFAAVGLGQGVRVLAAVDGEPRLISRAEPSELLRWLAELAPFGGLWLGELLECLDSELLGAETIVLAVPTWRSNAALEIVDQIGELCGRAPRVVVVLVETHTFEAAGGRGAVPSLTGEQVDELDRELSARGAWVARVADGEELAACLGRTRLPA